MMESDQGKLFIGGISWETTEDRLKDYFGMFGHVLEVAIMKDRVTGSARGFGFVVFADPAVADRVVLKKHNIDGRTVEARKAISRGEQLSSTRSNVLGRKPTGQSRTKKMFVGGLAPTVTENDFRKYFEQFGTIIDVIVMYDPGTQRSRGFGFITYDSEDAVDIVVQKRFHELNGKMVEVKRSIPKELSSGHIRLPAGRFGAGASSAGNFGASYGHGFNSSPAVGYGLRMNSSYGTTLGGRGAYPTYGPAGYNASGYENGVGYGPAMTRGSYGNTTFVNNVPSYGMSTGSNYGGAPISYVGPFGYEASKPGKGGYGTNATPGTNMWGGAVMAYGNTVSSIGYGAPSSAGITGYMRAGAWGPAQVYNGQSNGSNVVYANGYGITEVDYASSGAYAAQNNGHGLGITPYTSTSRGYGGAHSDQYGSSGHTDSSWRTNPAETVGADSGAYGPGSVAAEGSHK
jgi:RNA-binding protein Musashi